MEENKSFWIAVAVIALVAGLVGGYFYGRKIGYNKAQADIKAAAEAEAQKAAEAANPFKSAQTNPLQNIPTNPLQNLKFNPFK